MLLLNVNGESLSGNFKSRHACAKNGKFIFGEVSKDAM